MVRHFLAEATWQFAPRRDCERVSGFIPMGAMAQHDAVTMNGSDRMLIRGAPLSAGDAEWMVGNSRKHLAPDLDKGFLMDATQQAWRWQCERLGIRSKGIFEDGQCHVGLFGADAQWRTEADRVGTATQQQ